MNWFKIKDTFKQAATTVSHGAKAINFNIDAFEYKHFGDVDEKFDALLDKTGNVLATKAKSAKDWSAGATTTLKAKFTKEEISDEIQQKRNESCRNAIAQTEQMHCMRTDSH